MFTSTAHNGYLLNDFLARTTVLRVVGGRLCSSERVWGDDVGGVGCGA
jgi:hypothetical protein